MPEGHTIHRLAGEHGTLLGGDRLRAASPQGRFAAGAQVLDGRRLDAVEAWGKHLLYRFDGLADALHVHLGLYGSWTQGPPPPPEPRGAVRLRLEGPRGFADLRGPAACELMPPPAVAALLGRLGPDPLRPGVAAGDAWPRVRASGVPIAVLLLDQRALAGVGNVYRAEVLFRAGLCPHRPARSLTADAWTSLWRDLARLMRAGVRAGRIVTTRAADRPRRRGGGPVPREDSFYVYGRAGAPCRVCGTPVRSEPLGGRALFFCPRCQDCSDCQDRADGA